MSIQENDMDATSFRSTDENKWRNPISYNSSTSNEDEDGFPISQAPRPVTKSSSSDYLLRARPRSARRLRPSSLQHTTLPAAEPYSYTETEYWGWIILFLTWLLFTVGMGSCLEVWSWAWDVGETPYAPPELEDDPTLPIVGYYPALIVLTGVVAWMWITVAWLGMKHFRHAEV